MVRRVINRIFIAMFLATAMGCGGGYQVSEEPPTPQAATSSVPDRPTLESKIADLLSKVAASKNDAAVKTILKNQLEKASAKLQEESLEDSELESIASTLDTIEAQNTIAQNSVTTSSSTSASSASTSMLNLTQLSADSGTPLTVKSNSSTSMQLGLFTSDYVSSTAGSGLIFGKGATTGDTYSTIDAVKSSGVADLVLQGSGGKVGIGTTSPVAMTEIVTAAESFPGGYANNIRVTSTNYPSLWLRRSSNTTGFLIGVDNNGLNLLSENSGTAASRLTISSTGNVGIGTTAPTTTLHVTNTAGGVISRFTGSAANLTLSETSGNYSILNSNSSAGITFEAANNITASGGVLNATTGMTVGANPYTSTSLLVTGKDSTSGTAGLNVQNSSSSSLIYARDDGNVGIGTTAPGYRLTVNGQPGANGFTLFTNYSDRRLKTDIKPLEAGMLAKVMALRPSSFYYNKLTGYDEKTRSRKLHGFIAQDLKEVFPEMVAETKIGGKNFLDTNLSFLQIYLVKAIQELKAGIEAFFVSQSARIAKLEEENANLKEKIETINTALCELRPNFSLCSP